MVRDPMRVRTGCATCRIRKVKCDETKPSCFRCQNAGRSCAGYPNVPPRAKRKDAGKRRLHTRLSDYHRGCGEAREPLKSILPSPLVLHNESSVKRPAQIEDFKGAVLTRFLSTWPVSLGIESHDVFWGQQLPRFAYVEDAILHALAYLTLAVSDVRDTRTRVSRRASSGSFQGISPLGLEQYNRSLQALRVRRGQLTKGNDTVLMLCSAIFAMAGTVVNSNERILHNKWYKHLLNMHLYHRPTQEQSFLSQSELHKAAVPLYRLAARLIMIPSYPKTTRYSLDEAADCSVPVRRQDPFQTLEEASSNLDRIEDRGLELLSWLDGFESERPALEVAELEQPDAGTSPEVITGYARRIVDTVKSWGDSFLRLEITTHMRPAADDIAYKLKCYALRIASTVICIRLTRIQGEDELVYDSLEESFNEIRRLASCALQWLREPVAANELKERRAAWTDRSEFICPLWLVAVKCRNRSIRTGACRILEEWPYDENLWSAPTIARVARKVIEFEDPEAFSDVSPSDLYATRERLTACRLFFCWEADCEETELMAKMMIGDDEVQNSRFTVDDARNPQYVSHLRRLCIGSFRPELI